MAFSGSIWGPNVPRTDSFPNKQTRRVCKYIRADSMISSGHMPSTFRKQGCSQPCAFCEKRITSPFLYQLSHGCPAVRTFPGSDASSLESPGRLTEACDAVNEARAADDACGHYQKFAPCIAGKSVAVTGTYLPEQDTYLCFGDRPISMRQFLYKCILPGKIRRLWLFSPEV